MNGDNVIILGDLTLILNQRKIRGEVARHDPLADFLSLPLTSKLIDVEPIKIVPT
jgi:hypothetical protein